MFLPVKRVVYLHTKVFCFVDYFELIVANFQIQDFISTFEDIIVCSEVSSISPQEKLLGLIYLSQRYLHNSMIFNELKHTNLRLYLYQTSVQSPANFSPRRFCLGNYKYYYFTTNTSHESSLFLKVWILFLAGV